MKTLIHDTVRVREPRPAKLLAIIPPDDPGRRYQGPNVGYQALDAGRASYTESFPGSSLILALRFRIFSSYR